MKSPLFYSAVLGSLLIAACAAPEPTPAADAASPVTEPETAVADINPFSAIRAGAWRTDAARDRDVWRNPEETLRFFDISPDDTVIEISPGRGWYTDILAPYLATGSGTLIAAVWDLDMYEGDRRARIAGIIEDFKANYASDPDTFGTLEYSKFSAESGPLTAAASVDAVLTFRNVHNWMAQDYETKFFADAYAALKPGGVLGVVEHRLPSSQPQDPRARSGYVHEDYVKALAADAGFVFAAASEINANPADTADHPFGVWTLPPASRTSDRDGNTPEGFDPSVYTAIGESDRMTLKFIKPEAS